VVARGKDGVPLCSPTRLRAQQVPSSLKNLQWSFYTHKRAIEFRDFSSLVPNLPLLLPLLFRGAGAWVVRGLGFPAHIDRAVVTTTNDGWGDWHSPIVIVTKVARMVRVVGVSIIYVLMNWNSYIWDCEVYLTLFVLLPSLRLYRLYLSASILCTRRRQDLVYLYSRDWSSSPIQSIINAFGQPNNKKIILSLH